MTLIVASLIRIGILLSIRLLPFFAHEKTFGSSVFSGILVVVSASSFLLNDHVLGQAISFKTTLTLMLLQPIIIIMIIRSTDEGGDHRTRVIQLLNCQSRLALGVSNALSFTHLILVLLIQLLVFRVRHVRYW